MGAYFVSACAQNAKAVQSKMVRMAGSQYQEGKGGLLVEPCNTKLTV